MLGSSTWPRCASIRPDERIHGIFTEAGDAANVVPARTAATWFVRSPSVRGLQRLKERVLSCLKRSAAAAGCAMEHRDVGQPRTWSTTSR
ncbi:MAG: hypothetical protein R2701_05845 [Acidimicrobiales bacterium]